MNAKQEKINKRIDRASLYLVYLGGVSFIGLPILTRFLPILEWQRTFWLIVLMGILCLSWTLMSLITLFLRRSKPKRITTGPQRLQKLSPKKAQILGYIVLVLGMILFAGATYMFLPYSIKGINYLYVQNKQPITQIDLVTKARAGTGTSKFTTQNVEFEKLGKMEMWFDSARFKEGRYYEITMIPDTKYVLERTLIEE
ncbi:hypothetical protein ACFSTE_09240 [Aquimarina hainanensis]|uniref:Uncharacterized protein n=2 Tax=Aquimarina hainanensis TaxID=1578017 RepID=A0ABW5N7Y1_9FLAO